MSQDFKLKFDEMREGKPTVNDGITDIKLDELYETSGNVRNLCFVWPDGRMKFLNYAYLISCEYYPNESLIELKFTSEKINIKGKKLKVLFANLISHNVSCITCTLNRYEELYDDIVPLVNTIEVILY